MVDVPAEYRESFETESPNYVYNLESLKNDVRTLLNPEYVFDNYPCSWGGGMYPYSCVILAILLTLCNSY